MDRRCLLMAYGGLLLRCCVSLFPHSGQGRPPMYGDYEAQRHWMEVTYNQPLVDWYRQTNDNPLQYWGLDYPPLTAYHSWLCGAAAARIDPTFVAPQQSRGLESVEHRRFMRATVLLADLLVFLPACLCLAWSLCRSRLAALCLVAALVLYPGLVLIDHGHFQYNGVSLGLLVAAVAALSERRDLLGAAFFTLALNYKQMELYHALPFFCYLLGQCWRQRSWTQCLLKLVQIGVVVIGVFALLWLPFLMEPDGARHVLVRLFPFNRGLFEDKVANFWCSFSLLCKVKNLVEVHTLASICLVTTALFILPCNIFLFFDPTIRNLRFSLLNSALAFFLFSFQVHEKSILLAALPACMLFVDLPLPVLWFLTVSTASMLPLLLKDGLLLPTLACLVLFVVLLNMLTEVLSGSSAYDAAKRRSLLTSSLANTTVLNSTVYWRQVAFFVSMVGFVALTALSVFVRPPSRYPDLWPVLVSLYSFLHFAGFFVYFHLLQFKVCEEKLKIS